MVVQEYEADASGNLARRARTFAQRKITQAELRKGVQVELVDLSDKRTPGERVVVAWVERGEVGGEFDGRTARPTPGSIVAKSKAGYGPIKLTLTLGARAESSARKPCIPTDARLLRFGPHRARRRRL